MASIYTCAIVVLVAMFHAGYAKPLESSSELTSSASSEEVTDRPDDRDTGSENARSMASSTRAGHSQSSGHGYGFGNLDRLLEGASKNLTAHQEEIHRKHLRFLILRYIKHYAIPLPEIDNENMTSPTTAAALQQTDGRSRGWRDGDDRDSDLARWEALFNRMSDAQMAQLARVLIENGKFPAGLLRRTSTASNSHSESLGLSEICCIVG